MKKLKVVVLGGLTLLWAGLSLHYWTRLTQYAELGMYLTNTQLYVAVENWLLASYAAFSLCAYTLIRQLTEST